jgi:hypothetical protein
VERGRLVVEPNVRFAKEVVATLHPLRLRGDRLHGDAVMRTIYISGPMTGLPDFNYPAFEDAAKRLRSLGFRVESPHENAKPDPATWENWMRLAIAQVVKCDGVALLDGWDKSRGACEEVRLADILLIETKPLQDWITP